MDHLGYSIRRLLSISKEGRQHPQKDFDGPVIRMSDLNTSGVDSVKSATLKKEKSKTPKSKKFKSESPENEKKKPEVEETTTEKLTEELNEIDLRRFVEDLSEISRSFEDPDGGKKAQIHIPLTKNVNFENYFDMDTESFRYLFDDNQDKSKNETTTIEEHRDDEKMGHQKIKITSPNNDAANYSKKHPNEEINSRAEEQIKAVTYCKNEEDPTRKMNTFEDQHETTRNISSINMRKHSLKERIFEDQLTPHSSTGYKNLEDIMLEHSSTNSLQECIFEDQLTLHSSDDHEDLAEIMLKHSSTNSLKERISEDQLAPYSSTDHENENLEDIMLMHSNSLKARIFEDQPTPHSSTDLEDIMLKHSSTNSLKERIFEDQPTPKSSTDHENPEGIMRKHPSTNSLQEQATQHSSTEEIPHQLRHFSDQFEDNQDSLLVLNYKQHNTIQQRSEHFAVGEKKSLTLKKRSKKKIITLHSHPDGASDSVRVVKVKITLPKSSSSKQTEQDHYLKIEEGHEKPLRIFNDASIINHASNVEVSAHSYPFNAPKVTYYIEDGISALQMINGASKVEEALKRQAYTDASIVEHHAEDSFNTYKDASIAKHYAEDVFNSYTDASIGKHHAEDSYKDASIVKHHAEDLFNNYTDASIVKHHAEDSFNTLKDASIVKHHAEDVFNTYTDASMLKHQTQDSFNTYTDASIVKHHAEDSFNTYADASIIKHRAKDNIDEPKIYQHASQVEEYVEDYGNLFNISTDASKVKQTLQDASNVEEVRGIITDASKTKLQLEEGFDVLQILSREDENTNFTGASKVFKRFNATKSEQNLEEGVDALRILNQATNIEEGSGNLLIILTDDSKFERIPEERVDVLQILHDASGVEDRDALRLTFEILKVEEKHDNPFNFHTDVSKSKHCLKKDIGVEDPDASKVEEKRDNPFAGASKFKHCLKNDIGEDPDASKVEGKRDNPFTDASKFKHCLKKDIGEDPDASKVEEKRDNPFTDASKFKHCLKKDIGVEDPDASKFEEKHDNSVKFYTSQSNHCLKKDADVPKSINHASNVEDEFGNLTGDDAVVIDKKTNKIRECFITNNTKLPPENDADKKIKKVEFKPLSGNIKSEETEGQEETIEDAIRKCFIDDITQSTPNEEYSLKKPKTHSNVPKSDKCEERIGQTSGGDEVIVKNKKEEFKPISTNIKPEETEGQEETIENAIRECFITQSAPDVEYSLKKLKKHSNVPKSDKCEERIVQTSGGDDAILKIKKEWVGKYSDNIKPEEDDEREDVTINRHDTQSPSDFGALKNEKTKKKETNLPKSEKRKERDIFEEIIRRHFITDAPVDVSKYEKGENEEIKKPFTSDVEDNAYEDKNVKTLQHIDVLRPNRNGEEEEEILQHNEALKPYRNEEEQDNAIETKTLQHTPKAIEEIEDNTTYVKILHHDEALKPKRNEEPQDKIIKLKILQHNNALKPGRNEEIEDNIIDVKMLQRKEALKAKRNEENQDTIIETKIIQHIHALKSERNEEIEDKIIGEKMLQFNGALKPEINEENQGNIIETKIPQHINALEPRRNKENEDNIIDVTILQNNEPYRNEETQDNIIDVRILQHSEALKPSRNEEEQDTITDVKILQYNRDLKPKRNEEHQDNIIGIKILQHKPEVNEEMDDNINDVTESARRRSQDYVKNTVIERGRVLSLDGASNSENNARRKRVVQLVAGNNEDEDIKHLKASNEDNEDVIKKRFIGDVFKSNPEIFEDNVKTKMVNQPEKIKNVVSPVYSENNEERDEEQKMSNLGIKTYFKDDVWNMGDDARKKRIVQINEDENIKHLKASNEDLESDDEDYVKDVIRKLFIGDVFKSNPEIFEDNAKTKTLKHLEKIKHVIPPICSESSEERDEEEKMSNLGIKTYFEDDVWNTGDDARKKRIVQINEDENIKHLKATNEDPESDDVEDVIKNCFIGDVFKSTTEIFEDIAKTKMVNQPEKMKNVVSPVCPENNEEKNGIKNYFEGDVWKSIPSVCPKHDGEYQGGKNNEEYEEEEEKKKKRKNHDSKAKEQQNQEENKKEYEEEEEINKRKEGVKKKMRVAKTDQKNFKSCNSTEEQQNQEENKKEYGEEEERNKRKEGVKKKRHVAKTDEKNFKSCNSTQEKQNEEENNKKEYEEEEERNKRKAGVKKKMHFEKTDQKICKSSSYTEEKQTRIPSVEIAEADNRTPKYSTETAEETTSYHTPKASPYHHQSAKKLSHRRECYGRIYQEIMRNPKFDQHQDLIDSFIMNDVFKPETGTTEDFTIEEERIRKLINRSSNYKPLMGKSALLSKTRFERNDSEIVQELVTQRFSNFLNGYYERSFHRQNSRLQRSGPEDSDEDSLEFGTRRPPAPSGFDRSYRRESGEFLRFSLPTEEDFRRLPLPTEDAVESEDFRRLSSGGCIRPACNGCFSFKIRSANRCCCAGAGGVEEGSNCFHHSNEETSPSKTLSQEDNVEGLKQNEIFERCKNPGNHLEIDLENPSTSQQKRHSSDHRRSFEYETSSSKTLSQEDNAEGLKQNEIFERCKNPRNRLEIDLENPSRSQQKRHSRDHKRSFDYDKNSWKDSAHDAYIQPDVDYSHVRDEYNKNSHAYNQPKSDVVGYSHAREDSKNPTRPSHVQGLLGRLRGSKHPEEDFERTRDPPDFEHRVRQREKYLETEAAANFNHRGIPCKSPVSFQQYKESLRQEERSSFDPAKSERRKISFADSPESERAEEDMTITKRLESNFEYRAKIPEPPRRHILETGSSFGHRRDIFEGTGASKHLQTNVEDSENNFGDQSKISGESKITNFGHSSNPESARLEAKRILETRSGFDHPRDFSERTGASKHLQTHQYIGENVRDSKNNFDRPRDIFGGTGASKNLQTHHYIGENIGNSKNIFNHQSEISGESKTTNFGHFSLSTSSNPKSARLEAKRILETGSSFDHPRDFSERTGASKILQTHQYIGDNVRDSENNFDRPRDIFGRTGASKNLQTHQCIGENVGNSKNNFYHQNEISGESEITNFADVSQSIPLRPKAFSPSSKTATAGLEINTKTTSFKPSFQSTLAKSSLKSSNSDLKSTSVKSSIQSSKNDLKSTSIKSSIESSKSDLMSTSVKSSIQSSKSDLKSTSVNSSTKSSKSDLKSTSSLKSSKCDLKCTTVKSSSKSSKSDLKSTSAKSSESAPLKSSRGDLISSVKASDHPTSTANRFFKRLATTRVANLVTRSPKTILQAKPSESTLDDTSGSESRNEGSSLARSDSTVTIKDSFDLDFQIDDMSLDFLLSTDDHNVETSAELFSGGEKTDDDDLDKVSYDAHKFLTDALGDELKAYISTDSQLISDLDCTANRSIGTSNISDLLSKASSYVAIQNPPDTTAKRNSTIYEENCYSQNEYADYLSNSKKLADLILEANVQNQILAQTHKALTLCRRTKEFVASIEEIEAERILLIATLKREALKEEIQKIEYEDLTDSPYQNSGCVRIKGLTFPPKARNSFVPNLFDKRRKDFTYWFVSVLKSGATVFATKPAIPDTEGMVKFDEEFLFDNLSPDFTIIVAIYVIKIKNNMRNYSHESKFHLNKNGSTLCPSPHKLFHLTRDTKTKPPEESTASSSFTLGGKCVIGINNLRDLGYFKLTEMPLCTMLGGTAVINFVTGVTMNEEFSDFLNVGAETGEFIAWNRRWCSIRGPYLLYYNYPEDEEPVGRLDLSYCVTSYVTCAERKLCARPRTLLLETAAKSGGGEHSPRVLKHFLAADTLHAMKVWESKLNHTVSALRNWNCMKCNFVFNKT